MHTLLSKIVGVTRSSSVKSLTYRRGNFFFHSLRAVPSHIECPEYTTTGQPAPSPTAVHIFNKDELPYMREAAYIARYILDYALSQAIPGRSTDEVDALAHAEMIRLGVCPSPLNYHGFPKSICTSLNRVACHGIPRESDILQDGDKLGIDVSVFYKGYHGDNCATIVVGHDSTFKDTDTPDIRVKKRLIHANKEAIADAIAVCGPGKCITDIGIAIQKVSENYKFETIKQFCGHGLGKSLHMSPLIMHFAHNEKLTLLPGMVFTIEPIFCEKSSRIAVDSVDKWSAFTLDGGSSAQFEHEVLITEHGAEILTLPR